MNRFSPLGAVAIVTILAGCSANGLSIGPGSKKIDLSADRLQLAIGTANIAFDGKIGLNVVTTFRQPNGLSAVLVDTPTITGPTGFVVPPSAPSADAGTNHISASPQTQPGPTTFGINGGVFSYGFGPFNADNLGTAFYPGNPNNYPSADYVEPFYSTSGNAPVVLGGPPAYPFFNDGTFLTGFAGYTQGFEAFEAAPVAGTYSLAVILPIIDVSPVSFNATATLTNTTPLPAVGKPAFAKDGTGGGIVTVTVPADPRIVETMVYVADTTSGLFFAIGPVTTTGPIAATLPDKLGKCSGTGCQNGPNATPSLSTGDAYVIDAIVFDYPAFEAGPPGNSSLMPTIVGAGGQADISISRLTKGVY